MTNNHVLADPRIYNTEIAGSRLLWSRHQIVQLFRRFICEDRPVSAQYAGDNEMMVTRTVRLNPSFGRIYFEYGGHKAGNSSLLRSKEVQFSVEDGRGKSQFTSPRISDVLLDGQPVFHVPIPERVIQTDRRFDHRIQIPEVSAPTVIFMLPDGSRAEGRLADLSSGGIGVIGLAAELNVRKGSVVRNCLIEINDKESVFVDLEIRYTRGFIDAEGKPMRRVGFSLVSTPKEFADLLKAFTVDL